MPAEPEVAILPIACRRWVRRLKHAYDEIRIIGVTVTWCHYTVIPDRIEAGSFAAAAAITVGDVELLGAARGTYAGSDRKI